MGEYVTTFIDIVMRLLKAANAISWQLVVLALAFAFYRSISRLIEAAVNVAQRVKRFGDVEIDAIESQQLARTEELAVDDVALIDVIGDDPSLEPWAKHVENLVQQAGLNERSREREREKRLMRAWAHANRARAFDRVLRSTFHSQIDAMNKLSEGQADGKALKRFHTTHVERARSRGMSDDKIFDFKSWLRFLVDKEFIGKQTPGPYYLTDLGRAFVAHIREVGSAEAMPF